MYLFRIHFSAIKQFQVIVFIKIGSASAQDSILNVIPYFIDLSRFLSSGAQPHDQRRWCRERAAHFIKRNPSALAEEVEVEERHHLRGP